MLALKCFYTCSLFICTVGGPFALTGLAMVAQSCQHLYTGKGIDNDDYYQTYFKSKKKGKY